MKRMLGEPAGHLAELAPDPDAAPRAEGDDGDQRQHGPRREQEEAPVAVQALEEPVRPAAGDGEELERVERPLDGPRGRVEAVPGQHGPEPGDRAHGQEVRAQELHDQGRDDREVEGAVAEEVRGGDLLERGLPVHLLPEELLGLGDLDDLLGVAVLQGIRDGALAGVGQPRHLPLRVGDAMGPALEVGDGAGDLPDLEAVAVRLADEELEAGALLPVLRHGVSGLAAPAPGATGARRRGPWPRGPSG